MKAILNMIRSAVAPNQLVLELRKSESLKAAAILGAVILLAYGTISFLGYTLSPALWNYGVLVPPYGYQGRWLSYAVNMDPLASGGAIWPVNQLISSMLHSGQLPLWNPYQGTGAPLAADTTWSTYFPIELLYLVTPNQYWDFVWLLKLWTAGFLCYLFLRKLNLSSVSAIGGGLAYCLSGAFIFYAFLPWTNVAILLPALLFVAKKCFDGSPTRHTLAVGGAVFAISLLGAHIEALIIQFLYVNLFVVFEALTSKREKVRGVATWAGVVLLGLGLASFFLFPVFEYLSESTLARATDAGLYSLSTDGNPVIWWVTLFVPYFYGFLQTYPYSGLRQVFFWDISPGYVGTVVFFLSLLPLFSIRRNWIPRRTKYFVFFIIGEILILMKIFGIPPVNWIGYLPALNYVIFSRYSGSVLAMSFSGACAFGLQSLLKPVKLSSTKGFLLVLLAVGLGVWGTVPFPASPDSRFFPVSLAYLALSVFYLVLSFSMASTGGARAAKALVALIVLELVSYIPMSLSVEYEAIRVAILAGAALAIVGNQLKWSRFMGTSVLRVSLPSFLSRNRVFAMILIAALVLQFAVAGLSPIGLPNRYDPYTEAPYVRFLQANAGYQRVYSLDGVFFPPVAGLFTIQHLGEFSAFMPASFRNFSLSNLDRGAISSILSGGWPGSEKYSASSEIHSNLAFYSLLGVKYFVTAHTDLSVVYEILLQPETEGSFSWAPLGNNTVSTNFVTDTSFDGVLVRIGTYDRINYGGVLLTLDSLSGNATIHRVARLPAESIVNGAWGNVFAFSKIQLSGVTRFRLTLSQSDTLQGNEVAVMWYPQAEQNPHLSIENGSLKIAMGLVQREEALPVVYRDQNATIYQNLGAFPRTFLTDHVIVAYNETDAVLKTRDLEWNTRNTAVLEGNLAAELPSINVSPQKNDTGAAEIEQYSPTEVAIRVDAVKASFLILTDTFYPGWNAYVDGSAVPTYRAYGVVRAVFVGPGSHEVLFKYEPVSFRIGSYVSLLAVSIVALLLLTRRRSLFVFRKR
jgi:hypothetical protein